MALWAGSAICGLFAFLLDKIVGYLDSREIGGLRIALQELKARRGLDESQRQRIVRGLSALPPQEADIWVCSDLVEANNFAGVLTWILTEAKWKTRWKWPALTFSGLAIEVRENASEATKESANALISLLEAEGIKVGNFAWGVWEGALPTERIGHTNFLVKEADIRLVVGEKPT